MSVIFIVLPLAIVMAMIAVGAFLWAVHKGQFDDLEVPAYQVLFEDGENDVPQPPEEHILADMSGQCKAPVAVCKSLENNGLHSNCARTVT